MLYSSFVIVNTVIGLVIGVLLCYIVLSPKIKETQKINEEIAYLNEQNVKELNYLNNEITNTRETLSNVRTDLRVAEELIEEKAKKKNELDVASRELRDSIQKTRRDAEDEIYAWKQRTFSIVSDNLENEVIKEQEKYSNAIKEYEEEYSVVLKDAVSSINQEIDNKKQELDKLSAELASERALTSAAIEASKRAAALKEDRTIYSIILSEQDLTEVNRIREITPYFREPRPLNKAVWEGYFRGPATALTNRVVGEGQHTGIYKITNLLDNKVYIGQAVNLSDRIKEHIKAGLGIDSSNNNLYSAMKKDKVENFAFEVIEECDRALLNDREKFWIDYYQATDFGYNMTIGGSARR